MPTTGSKNSGNPVAVMFHEQDGVPWMDIAIQEAKRWHGTGEKDIEKTEDIKGDKKSVHNYHKLAHLGTSTMHGTSWCASFISYCIQESSPPPKSFIPSQSSQFPAVQKNLYREVNKPIYGALMVMRDYRFSNNKQVWQGHITFVYGKTVDGNIAGLGGNQGGRQFGGGTVKLSEYSMTESSEPFFIDITYEKKIDGVKKKITERNVKVYQRFFKFYVPVYLTDERIDKLSELSIVDIDHVNYDLFNIGKKSAKESGGI